MLTPPSVLESTRDLLGRWTALSSRTGDLAGLHRVAEAMAGAFRQRGLVVRVRELPVGDGGMQPVVEAAGCAEVLEGASPCLLAIGHLDTVLPAIEPRWEADRLIATGSADMKAGIAALAGALALLRERGAEPPRDLLVVVVPDEEVIGPLTRAAVADRAATIRALWSLEPGTPLGNGGETVVTGRRGILHWHLDVRGRGAHAGNDFFGGRSALLAAAAFCLRARARASEPGGPTINPARLVAGEADFVAEPALSPGLLGSVRQTNVVPDRARVDGEARFLRPAEGAAIPLSLEALATRISTEHEVECSFRAGPATPPLEPGGPGRTLAERAVRLAAEAGWRLEVEEDRGGISFPNFHPDPSSIPILDGLGPVGGGLHTREEWVDLRSLDRRIDLLSRLLADA